MHASIISPRLTTLALLVCLLAGCEVDETDQDGSGTPTTPPTQTPGPDCSYSPQLLPGATPQAIGAYCFGLALVGSELLGCVPTAPNVIQCVDDLSGTAYAVQWSGSVGNVVSGQSAVGTVTQQSSGTYEIALRTVQGRGLEPVGQCSLVNTTLGQQAKFCAYLAQ